MDGLPKSALLVVFGVCIASGLTFAFLSLQGRTIAPGHDESSPMEVPLDHAATERIAALELQLQEVQAQNEELVASLDTSKKMMTVLEQSFDDVAALADDRDGDEKEKNPMAKILETMGSGKLAKAQAGAAVQMGYSKLIGQLQLDAATKEAVRETLRASLTEQLEEQFRLMSSDGDTNREDRRLREEERKARLRDDLARILTRDQLDIYDIYDVEREMMASGLEMQLGMYARELTPENRELVRDVLIDEMLAMQAERETAGNDEQTIRIGSGAATAGLDNQIQAMQNAADRLAEVMDPEQFAFFEGYMQQQLDMFESVRDLVDATEEEVEVNGERTRVRRVVVTIP